jgi:uncharacterized protein (TIGR02246 family)
MSANDTALMQDEWAIRKMAMAYARTVDRGDGPGFAALFTEDAAIEGPVFRVQGYDQICGNPGMLKQMYTSTLHTVMNQTVTIAGDTAEGETYCIAYHVNKPDENGQYTRLDWAIRYQDKYVRRDGTWLYTHRQLLVEWTEVSPVTMVG